MRSVHLEGRDDVGSWETLFDQLVGHKTQSPQLFEPLTVAVTLFRCSIQHVDSWFPELCVVESVGFLTGTWCSLY